MKVSLMVCVSMSMSVCVFVRPQLTKNGAVVK